MLKQPFTCVSNVYDRFVELYGVDSDYQRERYSAEFDRFCEKFGFKTAYIASSSGRVEVIGNHTDHNGGRVISSAISLDTLAMFMPTDDEVIRVSSMGYDEIVVDLSDLERYKMNGSAALVAGVADALRLRGYRAGGFCACMTSNVIGGAGISSSAAFEVLIAEILNFLYNDGRISAEEKSFVSQYAENVFFGKPCGLLDQTAIAFGGLKLLDFSSKQGIKVANVTDNTEGFTFVLVNTGGSHANLTQHYAAIPAEMKAVASAYGRDRLIEMSYDEFIDGLPNKSLPDRAVMRAVHFYSENLRVDAAASTLSDGDIQGFFDAVNASGVSSMCFLQNCNVPGSEEQSIPRAISVSKFYNRNGAVRVHGGGFAGCVLNVIKNSDVDDFIVNMARHYGEENVIRLYVRSVGTIVL